jgi:hypothetical protein
MFSTKRYFEEVQRKKKLNLPQQDSAFLRTNLIIRRPIDAKISSLLLGRRSQPDLGCRPAAWP